MDLAGRKLGKYKLLERLGHGGMAQVYKAFQPGVEREVAIKVLHGHLADSVDFVERFRREALSIGQLQHPNIVRLIDFDTSTNPEDKLHYIVMDYIQCGTLADYLRSEENRILSEQESLQITLQMADALSYAHKRGMIHRDIKPGNVMFTNQSFNHIVLTDFGIARLVNETSALTVPGQMIGTPAYMSPEAARGEPCDERSDIYSLGVVLFRMLTGRPPFEAETPYGLLSKQANEPSPSPREFNPNLSSHIEALLLKILAKNPAERFQSAAILHKAIQQTGRAVQRQTQTNQSIQSIPAISPNKWSEQGQIEATTPTQQRTGFRTRTAIPQTQGMPPIQSNRWFPYLLIGLSLTVFLIVSALLWTRFNGLNLSTDTAIIGNNQVESGGEILESTEVPFVFEQGQREPTSEPGQPAHTPAQMSASAQEASEEGIIDISPTETSTPEPTSTPVPVVTQRPTGISTLTPKPTATLVLAETAIVDDLNIARPTLIEPIREPRIGERVIVVAVAGLYVHQEPGKRTSASFPLEEGRIFTVIEGPIQKDGYPWYRLKSENESSSIIGWAAARDDDAPDQYWLAPLE